MEVEKKLKAMGLELPSAAPARPPCWNRVLKLSWTETKRNDHAPYYIGQG